MSRACRGKLLLICNDEFHSRLSTDGQQQTQQQLSERQGADVDVNNMRTLFQRLQFHVIYHNNLTAAVITRRVSATLSFHFIGLSRVQGYVQTFITTRDYGMVMRLVASVCLYV